MGKMAGTRHTSEATSFLFYEFMSDLHWEVAASYLPGVEADSGAWLEEPLHRGHGAGLQVRGPAGL